MSDGVCNRCRKPLAFTSSSQELCPSCAEVARLEAALREARDLLVEGTRVVSEYEARALKAEAALATLRGLAGEVGDTLEEVVLDWGRAPDWDPAHTKAVGWQQIVGYAARLRRAAAGRGDVSYPYENAGARGHVWQTKDGEINVFAYNPADPHNGPRCVNCGYGFCHHCAKGPQEDCPTAAAEEP